ncbi:hypothetical protein MJO29_013156 [Puccinia striiformis f. sp. tritici]|nr:hypothetical protein MJO29_013156 [Puccinia striiformis f. sp. tritici]
MLKEKMKDRISNVGQPPTLFESTNHQITSPLARLVLVETDPPIVIGIEFYFPFLQKSSSPTRTGQIPGYTRLTCPGYKHSVFARGGICKLEFWRKVILFLLISFLTNHMYDAVGQPFFCSFVEFLISGETKVVDVKVPVWRGGEVVLSPQRV